MKTIIIIENDSFRILKDPDANKYVSIYENLCVMASIRNQNPYSKPENQLYWEYLSKEELIQFIENQ